MILCSLCGR